MKLPHRRQFLRLAAGATALPAFSHIARAQAYPSRPVTLIVFVPAGGTPDIIARLIGQSLSQRLGQSVVIDNRPGAGSNVAAQQLYRTFGFTPAGVRARYYEGTEDAIVMWCHDIQSEAYANRLAELRR